MYFLTTQENLNSLPTKPPPPLPMESFEEALNIANKVRMTYKTYNSYSMNRTIVILDETGKSVISLAGSAFAGDK